MPQKKPTNLFYVAALPVGILFAITACAYVVMIVHASDPQRADDGGLLRLMEQHGVAILLAELGVLALLTIAAIGTDEFWTRQ